MKMAFEIMAVLAFVLCLGSVGAVEQDMVDLVPGMIRAFFFLGLFALFGKLGGAFDYTDEGGEQD